MSAPKRPRAPMPLQGLLGMVLVVALVIVALAAPWIAPMPPNEMDLLSVLAPPDGYGSPHWLGTDALGRDVLSRLVCGARIALAVAVGGAVGAARRGR